jgi:tetratricopeptide (TPR) repeat protein
MRGRGYLFFVPAWILATSGLPVHATLQDDYLKIYLKINEADQFERQGDFRAALNDFTDCYQRLARIHESDPNWESALVVQRMRDCKREIDVLTDKAAAQPVATPAVPAVETPPAPVTPSPDDNSNDVTVLRQRLSQIEQELAATKATLANTQLENQTLHAQLDAVNQQLVALKTQQTVDDRVGQLMAQNEDLSDKLAAAQKQIESLTTGPKSSAANLRAQLKVAQDKLAESESSNAALQATTTTLRQQLDQAQADLTISNEKLAAAPTGSAEYTELKHENELMRGILQREVQEQSRRDGAKRLAQEEFDRLKITSKVMQEQLDILGSPMTPPTNDEERTLLASLKDGGTSIQAPDAGGNVLSAPAGGMPADTNMASATPPSTTMPDAGGTPAPSSPMTIPSTDSMSNSPSMVTPATTPGMTDNSTMPSTPPADTNAPASAPPLVAVTSSTDSSLTNMASSPTPPPMNSVAPSGSAPLDPSAPTQTPLPPATTTVTDTTIGSSGATTNTAAAAPPAGSTTPTDDSQYSTHPRLPDDMKETAQKAADYFKAQQYDDAAAAYQTILDKYPESLYAWSNLGVVRFQEGKLPEALKALQQAVKLSPTDAFSYSNLGIVYYQMNQYESAIEALERALALDPNDAKSHNYLGCACSQKGWQEVAEREFRKAIEIDETFGDAHFNLALVYATSKPPSLELARRHYNRAIELGIAKDPRLEKLLAQ